LRTVAASTIKQEAQMNTLKTALVTGANRGIGRAIALQLAANGFHVIAAARDANKATEVVQAIRASGGSAETIGLEMADSQSIQSAAATLAARHKQLDVLVNNAGIFLGFNDAILGAQQTEIEQSIQVNAYGPLWLTKALAPMLKAAGNARVVNVSSSAGSLSEIVNPDSIYGMTEGAPYRLSKVVLNGITGLLAKELRADGIKVNSMCPGWTQTDMGGAGAPNTPEQAALLALRLATLASDGPTGGFFNEAGVVGW
jgi:NAD(P)-dependent dehydrogenase (short-subunit alcohol dehydrogenase family)